MTFWVWCCIPRRLMSTVHTPASEAAKRRTFAIISHPDAGKTTLTEHLLLLSPEGSRLVEGGIADRREVPGSGQREVPGSGRREAIG